MDINKIMLIFSVVIGISQAYEGIKILYIKDQKKIWSAIRIIIEIIWILPVIYMILKVDISTTEIFLYNSYIIYNVFSWVVVVLIVLKEDGEDPIIFRLPNWIYYLSIIFGSYFALFSAFIRFKVV